MLVDPHRLPDRGEGPLGARGPLADLAAHADRGDGRAGTERETVGIDEPFRVPEFAAEPDRERLAGVAVPVRGAGDGTGEPEVLLAVREFGDLGVNPARCAERFVDDPQWT
ncbi:hypothetical protein GCM10027598_72930 [Amycolatopsis oliviviridis]|uniref:Uncharacterized protein n=1 Tax=Amycolatopsis oliviviridis TaxID=1471590 RepID=A0ABQ3L398_9PSEU|nr:hypothetical protein GCM10017790_02860 [Amycolatopsis oliviviridis]